MERAIDTRGAVAINVITMVGIGPLITIPLVLAQLAGPLALIGWIAGAIVALCDGLVWSELGTRYPGSGGTYVYLRDIFGRERWGKLFAFLYNWQFFLSSSLVIATGYIGFANYSGYLFPRVAQSPGLNHAVAVGVGLLTIALLYRRVSAAARFGAVLAVIAVGTLLLVGVAGFAHPDFHRAFTLAQPLRLGWGFVAGFGSALYITLYDYAGYSQVAFVGEEVREPRRTLPFSIVSSVLIVLALYLFVQIGVLGAVPWQTLVGRNGVPSPDATFVASTVVAHAWGNVAASVVTILILITAFASVYGGLLGNSRVPFAAARDGEFLPWFARLHPTQQFPHFSLLGMGAISLVACFFDLGTVIAILSSAGILIGAIGQIVALFVLHARGERTPFRMWLFPLPALVALAGWLLAFWYTGAVPIGIGTAWLIAGSVVFLVLARIRRWWPFAITAAAALILLVPQATYAAPVGAWTTWNTSRIVQMDGYPVFEVDGKPFFVYGAAFFYERIPRDEWSDWLSRYRNDLHINTIDLYVPWNWQEPTEGDLDFTGRTNPRRDLLGLLRTIHSFGFKVVLRPGPVIRNEWRNGGYPDWLLERPEYNMPLHDVLEGRYPATATLQNRHADAAADEWLHNATHLRYASQWLRDVLTVAAPYSHDIIAIALDDDQGAYLDNDTWPAPHWHRYIDWLKSSVQSTTGSRVPTFVNTWQMKVTADSPVWAWTNWYQSDAYRIGAHDRDQIDLSAGMVGTQSHEPIMVSEFQAGWLQGADENEPRPASPTNTALALSEFLADGAHGIVNFPVQDTIYPAGWEVPWANWAYAWDAALQDDLCGVEASPRYWPTAEFGTLIASAGGRLAETHPVYDVGIVWPPSLFVAGSQDNATIAHEADATLAMLQECHARGLICRLVDLRYGPVRGVARVILPIAVDLKAAALQPSARTALVRLKIQGRLIATLATVRSVLAGNRGGASLLISDDGSFGFVVVSNWSTAPRAADPYSVRLGRHHFTVPPFTMAAGATRLVPLGLPPLHPVAATQGIVHCDWFGRVELFSFGANQHAYAGDTPGSVEIESSDALDDGTGTVLLNNPTLFAVLAPAAGARIAALDSNHVPDLQDDGTFNVAASIGLLRDGIDPEPTPSSRDYIAAFTHPMPAGTFNRPYRCTSAHVGPPVASFTCVYDAPDLPAGGARFERTLSLGNANTEIVVDEQMTPRDPASTARLKSISGFAVSGSDVAISGASCFGVYDPLAHTVGRLCWRPDDLASYDVRQTRGAAILTLHFKRNDVEMRLGVFSAGSESQARALVLGNT